MGKKAENTDAEGASAPAAITQQPGSSSILPQNLSAVMLEHLGEAAGPQQIAQWVPPAKPVSGCPEGLERLSLLQKFIVQTEATLSLASVPRHFAKAYSVRTSQGQLVYYALEDFEPECSEKDVVVHFLDELNQEVFTIKSTSFCDGESWHSCDSELSRETSAFLPDGKRIGSTKEFFRNGARKLKLYDGQEEHQMTIKEPQDCHSEFCEYTVLSTDHSPVASILVEECCENAQNVKRVIKIIEALQVEMKATLIAAALHMKHVQHSCPGSDAHSNHVNMNCWLCCAADCSDCECDCQDCDCQDCDCDCDCDDD